MRQDGFYGFRNKDTVKVEMKTELSYLFDETKAMANNINIAPMPDIEVNPSPNIK